MFESIVTRRSVLRGAALVSIAAATGGCGWILYPDRRGNPSRGQLDVTIVLLDGLLVLLAIIPGVIAFIVDAKSGTLYLPGSGDTIQKVHVGSRKLRALEAALSRELGREIDLTSPELRVWRGRGDVDPATLRALPHSRSFDHDFVPGDRVAFEVDANGDIAAIRVG